MFPQLFKILANDVAFRRTADKPDVTLLDFLVVASLTRRCPPSRVLPSRTFHVDRIDHRVTEGPGGTEEERAAAAKRAAKRRADHELIPAKRQTHQDEEVAGRLASLAAPPPKINVFAAKRARKFVRVSGTLDSTPSESVHSMGVTVVRDIMPNRHFLGIKVFTELANLMDGLLGKGPFPSRVIATREVRRRPTIALSSFCLSRKVRPLRSNNSSTRRC